MHFSWREQRFGTSYEQRWSGPNILVCRWWLLYYSLCLGTVNQQRECSRITKPFLYLLIRFLAHLRRNLKNHSNFYTPENVLSREKRTERTSVVAKYKTKHRKMSPKRECEVIILKIHCKKAFERSFPGNSAYLYPLSLHWFENKSVETYTRDESNPCVQNNKFKGLARTTAFLSNRIHLYPSSHCQKSSSLLMSRSQTLTFCLDCNHFD